MMTAPHKTRDRKMDQETAHLVAMANDIAANLSFEDDAAERVADHLRRFWAPRMRSLLIKYAASDGVDLAAVVRTALKNL